MKKTIASIFTLLTILSCSDNDDGKNHFTIEVSGQNKLSYSAPYDEIDFPIENINEIPRSYMGGGLSEVNDDRVIRTEMGLIDFDENSFETSILLAFATDLNSTGTSDNLQEITFVYKNEPFELDVNNLENTPFSITFSSYGKVSERIKGTYSGTLCLSEAIDNNKCDIEENRIQLSGKFNIYRTRDDKFSPIGSKESPIDITPFFRNGIAPYTVDSTNSYYSLEVEPDKSYWVGLQNASSEDLLITVYNGPNFSEPNCDSVTYNESPTETGSRTPTYGCIATTSTDQTILYLQIGNSGTESTGESYYFSIFEWTSYESEGSEDSPVDKGDLSNNSLSFAGTVGKEDYENGSYSGVVSYYSINVTSGTNYNFGFSDKTTSFTDGTDTSLIAYIYEDNKLLCKANLKNDCSATASGTKLTIHTKYNGFYNGASFDLDITPGEQGHFISETIQLSNTESPHMGTVATGEEYVYYHYFYDLDKNNGSVYTIDADGTSPKLITIKSLDNKKIHARIFDSKNDERMEKLLCTSSYETFVECQINSYDDDGYLFLIISTEEPSGTEYTVEVKDTDAAYESQGDYSEPVKLNTADFLDISLDLSIGIQSSYYNFEVTPDEFYTITLSDDDDLDLEMRVGLSTRLCTTNFETRSKSSCSFKATSSSIGLIAYNRRQQGGRFSISLTRGGTTYEPELAVQLTEDLPINRANSTLGSGSRSTYLLPTTPGTDYSVSLTDITSSNITLRVRGHSYQTLCQSDERGFLNESCTFTAPDNTEEVTIIVDEVLRGSGSGTSFTLNVTGL